MPTTRECVLVAAVGGLLPTAARLAATYVANPAEPLPAAGMYFGLALFALIGGALAYGLAETNVRQALVLGIAAPGVITNIVSGVSQGKAESLAANVSIVLPFGSARAQTPPRMAELPASTPGSSLASASLQELVRQITVRPVTRNADAWSQDNVPVAVSFTQADGTPAGGTMIVPIGRIQSVPVPLTATSVRFTAGAQSHSELLSQLPIGEVGVQVTVKGKNDFLWALGARRQAIVSDVKVISPPR